ncbi:MAG: 6,7-dimethyl-8-ribityllumazine synthase [Candidatus Eremiobacteraeota bacterium]|nr:6,7-dimethyl-8-ribityllumazine synthase [Candidatus Eremiobacteraeota bacterium]MBC5827737.1 6,7-dimethyl-8-ribityllumazine synthase [Candidatus Eremiobacteraeota bacterium]
MSLRRPRFAIVRARFNEPITKALLDGALRGFAAGRIPRRSIDIVEVPGAFELPVAAAWLAKSRKYGAIVCIGCIVRGETPHFEYVASASAHGINAVGRDTGIPVILGVLTTDTVEQAWSRAAASDAPARQHTEDAAGSNKGYEAARAAIDMALLRRSV